MINRSQWPPPALHNAQMDAVRPSVRDAVARAAVVTATGLGLLAAGLAVTFRPRPLEIGLAVVSLVFVAVPLVGAAAVRGRTGGVRLARPPQEINLGAVVRATESHWNLVECFDRTTNTCPIAPVCGLTRVLVEARDQFLAVLDRHTLADVLTSKQELIRLWRVNQTRPG